jgi:hypothetical protein|tara:strand:- start:2110 stop:2319 length:210 start_codon:yes stop_codon:yes gene_type:complete
MSRRRIRQLKTQINLQLIEDIMQVFPEGVPSSELEDELRQHNVGSPTNVINIAREEGFIYSKNNKWFLR